MYLLMISLLLCRQRGRGSENWQNLVDVIYGRPLARKNISLEPEINYDAALPFLNFCFCPTCKTFHFHLSILSTICIHTFDDDIINPIRRTCFFLKICTLWCQIVPARVLLGSVFSKLSFEDPKPVGMKYCNHRS